jgi:hypothetical protein
MAFPPATSSVGSNTDGALIFNPWAEKKAPISSVQPSDPLPTVQSDSCGSAQAPPEPQSSGSAQAPPELRAAQPPRFLEPEDLEIGGDTDIRLAVPVTPLLPPKPSEAPFPPEPPPWRAAQGWKLQTTTDDMRETTRWVQLPVLPDDASAQAAYKRPRTTFKPRAIRRGSVARVLEIANSRRRTQAAEEDQEECPYPAEYMFGDTGGADAVVSGDVEGTDAVVSVETEEELASSDKADSDDEVEGQEEQVEGQEEHHADERPDLSQGPPDERGKGGCKYGPAYNRRQADRENARMGNFQGFGVILQYAPTKNQFR